MLVYNEISPVTVKLLDATEQSSPVEALFPFAYEEVIGKEVGNGSEPMIHLWRHEKTFVLGLRDRKLPYATEAMAWLEQQGYKTIVRHSGGAAVPLDRGVVNVSLIFPKRASDMNFRRDFDVMAAFIRLCLQPVLQSNVSHIHTGEVEGSYCPGDYDLSINGRKFCGISQRRQTRSYIVQAFVNVDGNGSKRAQLVKEFYSRATGGQSDGNALTIEPSTMVSLSELTEVKSAEQFISLVKQAAAQLFNDIVHLNNYDPAMLEATEQMLHTLRQRYDRESN